MYTVGELNKLYEHVSGQLDQFAPKGSLHETARVAKARTVLETAREELDGQNPFGPTFKIANAALAISQARLPHVDKDTEAKLLRLAIQLYDSLNQPERFAATRTMCTTRLNELGEPQTVGGEEIVVPRPAPSESSHGEPEAEVTYEGDEARDDPTKKWESLIARWRKQLDSGAQVGDVLAELERFVDTLFSRVPSSAEHLNSLLSDDIAAMRGELAGVRRPENPGEILDRATEARGLAYTRDDRVEDGALRRRWLNAALWNFVLWRYCEWGTNRPQLIIDVVGYVQSIQLRRRYRDDSRELLIAATELVSFILTDTEALPPLVFERATYLPEWMRHSAGTFLLLSGPEPVLPSLSRYDPRVGRHDRLRWAEELLKVWRIDPSKRLGACLSLLGLAGWNGVRLRRLLELIFKGSSTPPVDGIEFWIGAASAVLDSTRWVRVAANPWLPQHGVSGSSLSGSDEGTQIEVPNMVLKAVAAEITEKGTPSTIQGALFKGRRVPTYLCVNDFGPFGILKIDLEERVRREKRNFDVYAKRLHPRYRASECIEGASLISDNSTASRYKAILTSYVFTEEDEPRTLADWLRDTAPEAIAPLIERLFLTALGPWISHTSRAVADLRYDYPILRPSTGEYSTYAPDKTAESELRRLAVAGVREAVDLELRWDKRELDGEPGKRIHRLALAGDNEQPLINPLWLAAQFGELLTLDSDVASLLFTSPGALSTINVLRCTCHGDLHAENVLVLGGLARPSISVIDFEAAHEGHLCKDFARLESAILCRIFPWTADESEAIAAWFGETMRGAPFAPKRALEGTENLERAGPAIVQLRQVLAGCGQGHWPISTGEYQLAMFASLLPFTRYSDLPVLSRQLAFSLSSVAATSLLAQTK
jgi:hypothetical protein